MLEYRWAWHVEIIRQWADAWNRNVQVRYYGFLLSEHIKSGINSFRNILLSHDTLTR